MEASRDQIVEDQLHHSFWSINPNSGDTGGLLLNDLITIDEEKYAILEPALWKNTQGKFISSDHEVTLGSSATSVTLNEHYGNQQPSVVISSPSAGSYSAVSEVVLVPSVSISSPGTGVELITGRSFNLTVAYENAGGFSVNFGGSSETVLNNNTITLTAPDVANTYPFDRECGFSGAGCC